MLLHNEKIYVFNVLWPPANDHLSLSTEFLFVPIITIDKIGFCVRSICVQCTSLSYAARLNNKVVAQKLKRGRRTFELDAIFSVSCF